MSVAFSGWMIIRNIDKTGTYDLIVEKIVEIMIQSSHDITLHRVFFKGTMSIHDFLNKCSW